MTNNESYIFGQKLFVYTAAEKCHHRDIKFLVIHVVDQVDQNLFGAAVAKIVDQKEYFLHSENIIQSGSCFIEDQQIQRQSRQ